jgi:hypothetical protein
MVNGRTFALGAIGGAVCRSSRRSPGVPSPRRAQRPRRRLNRGSFTETVVRPGAAEETAEELAHARNGRPGRPAWASDVVDAAEVPGTRKAGLTAPGGHHLADPVCAVAASARNRQLTQDNDRLRRQFARALGRLRAAGQALGPACDPASAGAISSPPTAAPCPLTGSWPSRQARSGAPATLARPPASPTACSVRQAGGSGRLECGS